MPRLRRWGFVAACASLGLIPLVGGATAAPFPNANPITIGDCCDPQVAATYPVSVSVSGLTGNVTKVTATLNGLSHSDSADLDVLLVSPAGQKVLLLSDTGLSASSTTATFDDAAGGPVPNAAPIGSGTYQPTNNGEDCTGQPASDNFPAPAPAGPYSAALSAFNGFDSTGSWSLYVVDDCEVDGGTITGGLTLTITTSGSPATPFSNGAALAISDCCPGEPAGLYPSTILVSGLTQNITGMSVKLNGLTHGYAADLNVIVVGPLGQKVMLMSDAGRSASAVDLNFHDAAGSPLPAGSNLASGSYTPTDGVEECATGGANDNLPAPAPAGPYGTALSVFTGTDGNGTWSLYLVDDCGEHTGSLAGGWTLEISTSPTSVSVASFGAKRTSAGISVHWRTGQEVSLLGFNLYRLSGKARVKVNQRLIQGKGRGSRGASYSFLDRKAKRATAYSYRLQVVGLNGARSWRGTIKVKAR